MNVLSLTVIALQLREYKKYPKSHNMRCVDLKFKLKSEQYPAE